MGTTTSGEGMWTEKGYKPGKDGVGVYGRGVCMHSPHLDTSFSPQLTRGLCLFLLGIQSQLFITFLEPWGFPVTLVILKTPSGLLQSPQALLCIPLPRGQRPYALRSASHFPSQQWSWVGLDITKSHPVTSRREWGQTQMIWWEN